MCYTSEVSRNAFVINIISCVALLVLANKKLEYDPELKTQYVVVALFFLFVGLMQLFDYIFWTNSASSSINQTTTKIAMISNHLQPIVLTLLVVFVMNKKLDFLCKLIVGLYVVVVITYSASNWNKLDGTQKTAQSGDSLNWSWNHFKHSELLYTLFLASLVVLFYKNFSNSQVRVVSVLVVILSFFFSLWKYQIKRSTGRFWCYFASLIPIIYLGLLINHQPVNQ